MLSQALVRTPQESEEFYTSEGCHILEVWNRAGDPDVSIARARVEPGVTTRLHVLSATVERYLILSGLGRVDLEGLDPRPVGPGDLVYIPAGCGQRITNEADCDLVFLAICTPRFRDEVYEDVDPEPSTASSNGPDD